MKTEPVSKNSLAPFKLKSLQVILLFFSVEFNWINIAFLSSSAGKIWGVIQSGRWERDKLWNTDFRKQSEPISATLTRFKSFLFFVPALPAQLLLRVLEKSNMLNMEHFVCCLDIYFLIWSQLFPIEMYLYIKFFPAPTL